MAEAEANRYKGKGNERFEWSILQRVGEDEAISSHMAVLFDKM